MDWEPIETAPKDGTPILVWPTYSDGRAHEAGWREMKRGYMVENGGRWEHGYGHAVPRRPTHWMPLPDPPTEDNQDSPAHRGIREIS